MKNTTLVLGASLNETRYSNKAIKKLREGNYAVKAIGLKEGVVADVHIEASQQNVEGIDTVTLYLNPARQKDYYDYIMGLQPRRVIFNPGTENDEFSSLLDKEGIQSEVACTLVLLSTHQY